ncbi:MAG: hypothetical protein FWE48_05305, partial [Coriobacteriia bacterium]|nr:hypothetical protein [Coriobacteriia bacterium]
MIGIKFTILTSIKSRTFLLAVFAAVIAVAGITFGASVAEATAGSPLYSWGHIANGRLGRPATTESPNNRPARVLDESNIAQDNWVTSSTAAGGSWAINARGELFAWGAPWDAYQMGQGGVQPPAAVLTPENNSIARPMRVGTADNWVQVASVQSFVVLLSSDGEVYRLGNGVTAGNPANIFGGANASNIPVRVYGGPSNFVHITGGSGQIYALTEDGEMWVAGDNNQGQLANGAIGGSSMTLVKVENTDDDWVFADGRGSSALAINANGELFSWGSNSNGQTGQGVTLGITTIPTQIETASNWVDARKILNAGAALNSDGEIFMWGDNGFGRTGQGTAVGNTLQLSQVGNADNWVSLSGGNESMLALNEAGELWGWGANSLGQLGLGHNTSPQTTPQFVLRVRDAHVNASRGGGSHSIFVLRAEPRNLPMTKQLIMPKGTPLPTPTPSSVSFDFNFTPVRVRVSDSPVTYSRNVTDFAGIIDSPQTVSVSLSAPASSDDVAVPPTHTFAGELDLWEFFEYHLSEFPAGGVFVFNVSEASGSTTPSLPGIMTYCTNRFQVRVWICRDGDLLDIHAFPITGGTSPNYTVGAKSDIVFSNRYRVDVNLDITKQVTGQFA